MNLSNKNILILGLAISGVSTAKALTKMGASIIISDMKKKEELKEYIEELKDFNVKYVLGSNDVDLETIDLVIKSPGIPVEIPIIKKAESMGIEVITDIELASRISRNNMIAITGTNGKSTTTTLIGEIFKLSGKKAHVTGNIGVGILWEIVNSKEEDIFIIEASSFQLESTKNFKPNVSVIINITPDHINWHKTFDKYVYAKKKIFLNQNEDDYTILNYDDPIVRGFKDEVNSKVFFFSTDNILDKGVYLEDGFIVVNDGINKLKVLKPSEIRIPGKHNLQNALASIAAAYVMGIDIKTIANTLREFSGIDHRLKYVDTINGMNFYNDSKGTNPESSIAAVKAIDSPIILIAGGMDKESDFQDFVDSFNGKVKDLILLGETANKIKNIAISKGFNNIYIVDNMEGAVRKAYEVGEKGDNILLSPACASWDMYKSYEERGNDFIRAVKSIRGA